MKRYDFGLNEWKLIIDENCKLCDIHDLRLIIKEFDYECIFLLRY